VGVLPFLVIELREHASRRPARVDHQRIEPPELAYGPLDSASRLLAVGDIGGCGDDADAVLAYSVGGRLQRRVGPSAHANMGSPGGKPFADGSPHSLARPPQEGGTTAKPQIHGRDPSSLVRH